MCLRRTLIKSPIWQLVPCPHWRSHSCERLPPGKEDNKRQEEAFPQLLSDSGEQNEGVVDAGQAMGSKDENKNGKGL